MSLLTKTPTLKSHSYKGACVESCVSFRESQAHMCTHTHTHTEKKGEGLGTGCWEEINNIKIGISVTWSVQYGICDH